MFNFHCFLFMLGIDVGETNEAYSFSCERILAWKFVTRMPNCFARSQMSLRVLELTACATSAQ